MRNIIREHLPENLPSIKEVAAKVFRRPRIEGRLGFVPGVNLNETEHGRKTLHESMEGLDPRL